MPDVMLGPGIGIGNYALNRNVLGSYDAFLYPDAVGTFTLRPQKYIILAAAAGAYFGVLKRWTGATWTKAKLKVWTGTIWGQKRLYRWTGSAWVEVDATGV